MLVRALGDFPVPARDPYGNGPGAADAPGRRKTQYHCTPYDVRARWHATRAHNAAAPPGRAIDTHWTSHTMAAAPLALDKHRGLRLRDANRPITAPQKRVELEVTPDKAPTLRGVAPAVGFYAWATPHKKQQPRTRAISHPALREPISKATPLSQAVRQCDGAARRVDRRRVPGEARGAAAAEPLVRSAVRRGGFGFKICLGRRSVDARRRSTRAAFWWTRLFRRLCTADELCCDLCGSARLLLNRSTRRTG